MQQDADFITADFLYMPCQYFTLQMMGARRPKHVQKVCSNKICILLHHVGVFI